ncbi:MULTISPECIES: magnesium transporter MgtE N-terminal domain-containing protein [unclassified Cryobacterium]|uniref:magnesium transporter MgtE N-terminal domain-containing protein n=1 Tax=unclassified Cryobacterium TaxID=2649013 RepID=UPI002AB579E5|nr:MULTISPECIES: CBS domain-containing protein [unclassified Cryobacterium]MDY7526322.1 CBS domain-containing protein [Cryobacterium sp. 10C2]MDY7557873.1 CBS domain-containing protein [Cryobacterium sp. 10C3]
MKEATVSNSPVPTTTKSALRLSQLLRHAVVDSQGKQLAKLADVIVRLRGDDYPLVTALVVKVGSETIYVPIADVRALEPNRVELTTARLNVRAFQRRPGEVLLNADVLGHRLIDVHMASLVRAHDIYLSSDTATWAVTGLNVHQTHWWSTRKNIATDPARDWKSFEALIGHEPSVLVRAPFGKLRRLKAAQIADLIETADAKEQSELLTQVHNDPEFEADVFEELDEDSLTHLLKSRSTADVASVLTRMRADDAADAITDLPQARRREVLALLPEPQHTKVLALLGYHTATAGGLMGVEYLALAEHATIQDALDLIRTSTTQQPEALTTIYSTADDGTLRGAISIIRALQTDPHRPLREVADPDPVHAAPQDDIIDVTTRMADFNLLTLPVLDESGHILGIITVDDALEAALPQDWQRREPQTHASLTPGAV